MLYTGVEAGRVTVKLAEISWEGNSLKVLRSWPRPIREDFGACLWEMQAGNPATLTVRPMISIAASVFELKDQDGSKWYRMIYLARVKDVIYVLHCFTKDSAKTEKRDLATAKARWKQIQQRLRGEPTDVEGAKEQLTTHDKGKRAG